jgi:hypothetical protein
MENPVRGRGVAGKGAGRRLAGSFVATVAILAASAALAAPFPVPSAGARVGFSQWRTAPVPAWDCWVEPGEGGGIRCIADRDWPLPLPEEYTDDDESAEVLLELVHDYLHRGKPRRAGELVQERIHLLRRGDLWSIRLSAPPFETSWEEARPQQLVRALLCPPRTECAVRFHR